MSELTVVGKPVTRVDANEKVTGQIVYGYDLVLPNMLYGKTLFSPKAHARIKKINTEKAKRLPGVVAAVAAEDEDTAQAAVKLIEVEYEDLPVYTDPEEACKPGAIAIHEDFPNYRKAEFVVPGANANIAEHFKLRTGDV